MELQQDGLPIAKLVFLREAAGGRPGRKAVVPLIEGADFEQFLGRVRSRLGLPAAHAICLRDEDMQVVDSIERLLEVDESSTLSLDFDRPEQCSSSVAPAPAVRRPSVPKVAATPEAAGATCRVDIATSPGIVARASDSGEAEGLESGELKYRKKRLLASGISRLARLRRIVIPLAVVVGLGTIYLMVSG